MPTFPAPGPVPVLVDVPFGNLHVVAGDRDDVVVTVLPAEPAKSGSVRAAEETRVARDGDAVTIVYPAAWKQYVHPFSAGGARVTIELPAGSDLRGKAGSLYAEGRLGTVDLTLNGGDARIDEAARLRLKVSAGAVVVRRVTGATEVKASAGGVRLDEMAGEGTVRASNGPTQVGSVTGVLEIVGAHAEIVVGRVRGTLTAKAAHAGIRVGPVESGNVRLTSSYGSIEVGVPEGTAAWLDVASEHGSVRNQLTPTHGPVEEQSTAQVFASTGWGDVILRRP
ncbi:DUF4097 family beta strand repeat-containing protein [Cellulomonas shaoxiangyii]|uniref:Adhesin domain-containing protein n=1 Tax=Cellulomonas shaoxiangyii TaxID=2566013 RepID=A0A4P7SHT0_9CELL|nr:DUF4097 family beta strand repeat-containing protein [Cellulomonas shaoxiangyii]QCB93087.1 hypothetical protein E5225_05495 [Cellulomonas shaoxiangyii]TGY84883.1 hypothetical protein E5226_09320 [Cellulomonas shaoxiangyii]